MPASVASLDRVVEGVGADRVDDDGVDAGGDEVAEVLELTSRVGVAVGDVELATSPDASACALMEQIISSRQPLPWTVLVTPMS